MRLSILAILSLIPAVVSSAQDLPRSEESIDKKLIPTTFFMRKVPAGKITIKDTAGKDKEVAIKPFWIAETEVAWDLFDPWVYKRDLTAEDKIRGVDAETRPSIPYKEPDRGFGHAGYPAMSMTYQVLPNYLNWLNRKTGKRFRLPTEAEWEYACRAGGPPIEIMTREELDTVAWYAGNSDQKTHAIGKKKPNKWSLYDMLGNVGEYVLQEQEDVKIIKGGSFKDPAASLTSGFSEQWTPQWQAGDAQFPKDPEWMTDAPFAGFRLVRDE